MRRACEAVQKFPHKASVRCGENFLVTHAPTLTLVCFVCLCWFSAAAVAVIVVVACQRRRRVLTSLLRTHFGMEVKRTSEPPSQPAQRSPQTLSYYLSVCVDGNVFICREIWSAKMSVCCQAISLFNEHTGYMMCVHILHECSGSVLETK